MGIIMAMKIYASELSDRAWQTLPRWLCSPNHVKDRTRIQLWGNTAKPCVCGSLRTMSSARGGVFTQRGFRSSGESAVGL